MDRPRTGAGSPPPPGDPPPRFTYRALRLPSGRLLAIEERIGRRLTRTIRPESPEGRSLLREGRVEVIDLGEL